MLIVSFMDFFPLNIYNAENVNVSSVLRISFGLGEKNIKLIEKS